MSAHEHEHRSPNEDADELRAGFASLAAERPVAPLGRMRARLQAQLDARVGAQSRPRRAWLRVASFFFVVLALGAIWSLGRGGPEAVYGLVRSIEGECVQQTAAGWEPVQRPVLAEGTVLRAGAGGCSLRLRCGGRIEAAPGSVLRFRQCERTRKVILDAPARGVLLAAGSAPLPFAIGTQVFECRGSCEVRSCCQQDTRYEVSVLEGCCQQLGLDMTAGAEHRRNFRVECRKCGGCGSER